MGKIIYDFLLNVLIGPNFNEAEPIAIFLTAISIGLIYLVLTKLVFWLFGVGRNAIKTRRY